MPTVDFARSGPAAWQWALAAAGLLAFAGLFLQVVMTQRPLPVPLSAMLGVSIVLTLAVHQSFALLLATTCR